MGGDQVAIPRRAYEDGGRWLPPMDGHPNASAVTLCKTPANVEGSRFRRQSPKWHDGLRGEEQKWDRHAGSSLPSIRPKL